MLFVCDPLTQTSVLQLLNNFKIHNSRLQFLNCQHIMEMSSDEEDNPYDFEAKYNKLQMEYKTKQILRENNSKQTESDIDVASNNILPINSETLVQSTASVIQPVNKEKDKRKCRQSAVVDPRVIGPVITIGNFDEGYDRPVPKRTLYINNPFTSPNCQNDDYDDNLINREMSVKVYWRNKHVHRFKIRMTIESIFEFFSKLEEIDKSFVLLELNKKHLTPSDTPNSINYKIADFIDGDVGYRPGCIIDTPKVVNEPADDEVKFRIIRKDVKKPMFMCIKKTDSMQVLYIKLSEKLCLQLNSFTLLFEGEKIKYSDTMETLDLEGDECFDLIEKK